MMTVVGVLGCLGTDRDYRSRLYEAMNARTGPLPVSGVFGPGHCRGRGASGAKTQEQGLTSR